MLLSFSFSCSSAHRKDRFIVQRVANSNKKGVLVCLFCTSFTASPVTGSVSQQHPIVALLGVSLLQPMHSGYHVAARCTVYCIVTTCTRVLDKDRDSEPVPACLSSSVMVATLIAPVVASIPHVASAALTVEVDGDADENVALALL